MNKCRICKNFDYGSESCGNCDFIMVDEYDPTNDDWDILNLDPELDWEHFQIMGRLYSKNIECLSADISYDDNTAIIIGCTSHTSKVASALNIHQECIYEFNDGMLLVLNLYHEKCLRERE